MRNNLEIEPSNTRHKFGIKFFSPIFYIIEKFTNLEVLHCEIVMLEHGVHCCEAERRKGAYILDFVSGVHHHGEILMEMFLSKIVFLH